MDRLTFGAVLLSVLMGSVAQIVLKAGVSTPTVVRAVTRGFGVPAVFAVAASPLVWVGLTVYAASAIVWLVVLARVQVSLAYPFVGLGFIVTMLLGWIFHGDDVGVARVAGTLLIALGVVVLARS